MNLKRLPKSQRVLLLIDFISRWIPRGAGSAKAKRDASASMGNILKCDARPSTA
ncbi:hypothetical protein [Ramlibacter humi]|uniref:hypothetical protein n=1 Tax=Ramlibacter humi TaxID=2530451 RepID=UPI001431B505|nr:hypothetical protein [Ramlibacter humi]